MPRGTSFVGEQRLGSRRPRNEQRLRPYAKTWPSNRRKWASRKCASARRRRRGRNRQENCYSPSVRTHDFRELNVENDDAPAFRPGQKWKGPLLSPGTFTTSMTHFPGVSRAKHLAPVSQEKKPFCLAAARSTHLSTLPLPEGASSPLMKPSRLADPLRPF